MKFTKSQQKRMSIFSEQLNVLIERYNMRMFSEMNVDENGDYVENVLFIPEECYDEYMNEIYDIKATREINENFS